MPVRKLNAIKQVEDNLGLNKYVKRFVSSVVAPINALNQAIDLYNQEQDQTKKLERLRTLYEDLKRLNNGCSDEIVSLCNYHEEIHRKLFSDIQNEFKTFDINSMQPDALKHEDVLSPSEIIANMAPEKLEQFAKILGTPKYWWGSATWAKNELNAIYAAEDEGYSAFKNFLGQYKITALTTANSKVFVLKEKAAGTASFMAFLSWVLFEANSFFSDNSKVFVLKEKAAGTALFMAFLSWVLFEANSFFSDCIDSQSTQSQYVIQLENRLGMSQNAEVHLRKYRLLGVFLPHLVDRQTSYIWGEEDSGVRCIRNMQVMNFLEINNLEKDRKTHTDNTGRVAAALDIYTQMAEVLGVVEANGCVFPDMKNSNWLIDKLGNLRISDTKSFLFTNQVGQLDVSDVEGKNGNYGVCVNTPHMNPPEILKDKPDAGQLHAYMLGRNLYQYLTQCSNDNLLTDDSGRIDQKPKSLDDLDFSGAVFDGSPGEALKALIQDLMATNPADRLSVADARKQLKAMGNALSNPPPVRRTSMLFECAPLINQIEKFRVTARGVRDVKMDEFLESMNIKMQAAETEKAMHMIKVELETMRGSLENSKAMVQDIEKSMNQWGYDMQAKGERVGRALAAVPLDERGAILEVSEGGSEATEAVLKAMASQRHVWRGFSQEEKAGTLKKDKKQARMFTDFKKKYQAMRTEGVSEEKTKSDKAAPESSSTSILKKK